MLPDNNEYKDLIEDIKEKVREAQYRAMVKANAEMIRLYLSIGKELNEQVKYGNSFIDTLAKEIKLDFPKVKGFSARNLRYMKKFAKEITDEKFLQTVSANLTWSHNLVLLEKLHTMEERTWYGLKTIENAWSVDVLEFQISGRLMERQNNIQKIQNFELRLPKPQSELAIQTMKDPYVFDFVEIREGMLERDVENELVSHITNFLLEMGSGFAYMGQQKLLKVEDEEFFPDLLFYNTILHCYVVIDLKMKKFKPEYAGKMNFYLSLVDEQLKGETDNPSIGLILCREKNKVVAEYSLKDMSKPIGVSEYRLTKEIPEEFKRALPDADSWEKHIKLPETDDKEDN
jgi:predicted nuclease of restriction endonuclease-like (RecB) superfamily